MTLWRDAAAVSKAGWPSRNTAAFIDNPGSCPRASATNRCARFRNSAQSRTQGRDEGISGHRASPRTEMSRAL